MRKGLCKIGYTRIIQLESVFFMDRFVTERNQTGIISVSGKTKEWHMKYVLVTGAYGGMGRSVVESLCAKGYHVFALDRQVGEAQENVTPVCADITDVGSIENAYQMISAVTQDLYAILHFAGIYMLDSLVEISPEKLHRMFMVNVLGAMQINQVFMPMLGSGSRILMTTSELAPLDPLPFTGLYAVAKGALDKYAYSLRMELQLLSIQVSVLRAGAVQTGMLGVSTDALQQFVKNTQLYQCNASRFKKIVDTVEARHIPPSKLAKKAMQILHKKKPKFAYAINRNPLLRLFGWLPRWLQFWIIRMILK